MHEEARISGNRTTRTFFFKGRNRRRCCEADFQDFRASFVGFVAFEGKLDIGAFEARSVLT